MLVRYVVFSTFEYFRRYHKILWYECEYVLKIYKLNGIFAKKTLFFMHVVLLKEFELMYLLKQKIMNNSCNIIFFN